LDPTLRENCGHIWGGYTQAPWGKILRVTLLRSYVLLCLLFVRTEFHASRMYVNTPRPSMFHILLHDVVLPAKAREYVFAGVGLCLSVCDHDN